MLKPALRNAGNGVQTETGGTYSGRALDPWACALGNRVAQRLYVADDTGTWTAKVVDGSLLPVGACDNIAPYTHTLSGHASLVADDGSDAYSVVYQVTQVGNVSIITGTATSTMVPGESLTVAGSGVTTADACPNRFLSFRGAAQLAGSGPGDGSIHSNVG
jgi:hypothetical protein